MAVVQIDIFIKQLAAQACGLYKRMLGRAHREASDATQGQSDAELISSSAFYDADWYLDQNPDVNQAGIDPAEHYLAYGAREGRNPGPRFDTDWYLNQNPDVRTAGINPLVHYLRHGAEEGRLPAESSVETLPSVRSQYKQIWNFVSGTEDDAKLAVSGYTDENLYRQTAEGTCNLLQECVGIRSEDVILEIGAGVGRVGAMLAPLCHEWIGADVSENMVKHIQRRLKKFSNVRTEILNGYDLRNIASGSVDLVYCTVVFMHIEEWERYGYIREGLRVLRPGGRMLVDNVNLLSDDGWAMFEELSALPPTERPPHISKPSTPQELHSYFRRAGFQNIGQAEIGLWIVTYGVKPANG